MSSSTRVGDGTKRPPDPLIAAAREIAWQWEQYGMVGMLRDTIEGMSEGTHFECSLEPEGRFCRDKVIDDSGGVPVEKFCPACQVNHLLCELWHATRRLRDLLRKKADGDI